LKGCAFWLSYVKEEKNLKVEETEIVIPGGFLLIGMGIGFLVNNLLPFMFIGLGIGILASYTIRKNFFRKVN
jgi:hypothetical protein